MFICVGDKQRQEHNHNFKKIRTRVWKNTEEENLLS